MENSRIYLIDYYNSSYKYWGTVNSSIMYKCKLNWTGEYSSLAVL